MNFKKTWRRFFTVSRASEGFTLVELIVVIAILAILAGIAVPAYSGYIKKANKAADLQLLGAVNTAFAAAALENGDDVSTLTGANMPLAGTEGSRTINVTAIAPAEYQEAFARYFEGNTAAAFKVISGLVWDNSKKSFCDINDATEISFSYGGTTVTMSAQAAAALAGSTWGTNVGSEELLGLVTNVTGMAGEIDNEVFLGMLDSTAFDNAATTVLGQSMDTLINTELNAWKAQNPDATEEEIEDQRIAIAGTVGMNTAVLVAANNAQAASSNIMDILTSGSAKDTIKTTMDNETTAAVGLSQAALAYGMYSSYLYYTDPDSVNPNEPIDFVDALNAMDGESDTFADFKTYLESDQGQQDMAGYLAALNTVSGNTGAASHVAVNGFDDAQLAALLGQIMG